MTCGIHELDAGTCETCADALHDIRRWPKVISQYSTDLDLDREDRAGAVHLVDHESVDMNPKPPNMRARTT